MLTELLKFLSGDEVSPFSTKSSKLSPPRTGEAGRESSDSSEAEISLRLSGKSENGDEGWRSVVEPEARERRTQTR